MVRVIRGYIRKLGSRCKKPIGRRPISARGSLRRQNALLRASSGREPRARHPRKVEAALTKFSDWGALGYAIGKKAENKIPYITGIKDAEVDELKSFCASVVTYGAKPLFYMEGITPGAERWPAPKETVTVEQRDIQEAYARINDDVSDIDFVCIGCPHCSIKEIAEIARLLEGKKIAANTEFWVATSRSVKQLADKRGYTAVIEQAGANLHATLVWLWRR